MQRLVNEEVKTQSQHTYGASCHHNSQCCGQEKSSLFKGDSRIISIKTSRIRIHPKNNRSVRLRRDETLL